MSLIGVFMSKSDIDTGTILESDVFTSVNKKLGQKELAHTNALIWNAIHYLDLAYIYTF